MHGSIRICSRALKSQEFGQNIDVAKKNRNNKMNEINRNKKQAPKKKAHDVRFDLGIWSKVVN